MLSRFKKANEKIAMGLLSFMPDERDLKVLQQTIKKYIEDDAWQLFLWKDSEDIIGLIGVVLEENDTVELKHISVDPSRRSEGVGTEMVSAIKTIYDGKHVQPSDYVRNFFNKCTAEEN